MTSQPQTMSKPLLFSADYEFKQYDFESRIRTTLQESGYEDIPLVNNQLCVFDLSKSYWHDLGTLLWLVSLLHRLKGQGNEIHLILPEIQDSKGENVWDFLIRWRFFQTLSVCVDDPVNMLQPSQLAYMGRQGKYSYSRTTDLHGVETTLFSSRILEMTPLFSVGRELKPQNEIDEFLGKYNDRIILSALSGLCGWDVSLTKRFIQEVIGEGIRNSSVHAGGTFSVVAMNVDNKNLTLSICDNGLGIPSVLRTAFKDSKLREKIQGRTDIELIRYFTEPEMIVDSRWIKLSVQKGTSSHQEAGGMGLYYLKSLVLSQGGELRVRSGKACVDFSGETEEPRDTMLTSPGTMLRIRTPRRT